MSFDLIALKDELSALSGPRRTVDIATQRHIEQMLFGGLMIFFLIVEPHGFARLWQISKEKLRLWPYPH